MAGGRARGANARFLLGMEASYGALLSVLSWFQVPFVSANLGDEQGLVESDVLGFGRMPQQPGRDAVNNAGDVVVPLCARNIGLWYTLLLGAPTTVAGVAATGALTFSAQPANNSTVTIAGQDFTFVSATPTANQIKIGPNLKATITNAVRALNASGVAGVAAATYWGDPETNKIHVLHDAVGTGGNSFTLAASAVAVTASGATLTGGAATGGYRHTWKVDASSLTTPSATAEVGMPEVPSFAANYGLKANTYGVPLQRSGNLNATIGTIAQGETPVAAETIEGAPTVLVMRKFSAFSGTARRNGMPFGPSLVSGQFNYSNGADPVPTVGRGDGRIGGVDEGMAGVTGSVGIRYNSTEMQTQAENGEACELAFSWAIPGSTFALRHIAHAVYLPKAKRPITGPGAVQADYNWQGAQDPVTGRLVTFVLDNDVAEYVVPEAV
ncbi:phage tail tube protein [Brevundimonas sp. 1P8-tot-C-2]|uniref:phage tail tube protein n=1 Tax=unclassified Brevundimonas TaxID=2622653 RepID=UPI0039A26E74